MRSLFVDSTDPKTRSAKSRGPGPRRWPAGLVIAILANLSRALLATPSPRQDLTTYLIVLRAELEIHGAPEIPVSDSGSGFTVNHAKAILLGIAHRQIAHGQAWRDSFETRFNVMRRIADYHSARATTWPEPPAAHDRFVTDDNWQAHFALQERAHGRHLLAPELGWVLGAWCDPAQLDRLFCLRAPCVLTAHGYVRFRHLRLYGARGLAGARAAGWGTRRLPSSTRPRRWPSPVRRSSRMPLRLGT